MTNIERAIDDLIDVKWRIQGFDGVTDQDNERLQFIVDDLDDLARKLRMVETR